MSSHQKVSGLSGNEIFCLDKVQMKPGQLCIGNSVVALGIARGIGAGLSTLGGGEVTEVTRLVQEGRKNAFDRMMEEAKKYGGVGLTGVEFSIANHGGNIEFITTGSTVHKAALQWEAQPQASGRFADSTAKRFSTSADAQQLYCQLDCGFEPLSFVFGNVAYSIGIGGNIMGAFRQLARGEVKEYSKIFDRTRHLALERIIHNARQHGANAVLGIQTNISSLLGSQEMIMVGTAAKHTLLNAYSREPVTSDMTNEEMWNMVNLGYMPIRLVMGVSVYSLGLVGGIGSLLQSLGGGEVAGLTEILYEAREKALERIEAEAEKYGADEVVGVKTRVYDLGRGMVEFMVIGTAVKKIPGTATLHDALPPQAIIRDRDTFIDTGNPMGTQVQGVGADSASRMQRGPIAIFGVLIYLFLYLFIFKAGR
jgi:uncharacterized protein YbjQ (UPF0145 family)